MKHFSKIAVFSLLIVVASVLRAFPAANAVLHQKPTYHATTQARKDETPSGLLRRCGLDIRHTRAFLLLNELSSDQISQKTGKSYRIPAYVHEYDGKSIITSLGIPMTEAILLRETNAEFTRTGIKPSITDDQKIWVPYDHVLVRADTGQAISDLLSRFSLGDEHISAFQYLNGLDPGDGAVKLEPGQLYRLPVHIESYHGPTIRQALGVSNAHASEIAAYNKKLYALGLKPQPWDDHLVWVRYQISDNPAYGPIYRKFEVVSNQLADSVIYLSPGHGGPDPGTSGGREGENICEDEYVLDITLRLARELQRHGAQVEVLIKDEGIRDTKFLPCDEDEVFLDGREIPLDKVQRLQNRVDLANSMYSRRSSGSRYQRFLALHIDFRSNRETRVDFDIYHYYSSAEGRQLAETLQRTIEGGYGSRLGGRDFVGRIKSQSRDDSFYVLRETHMPAVLVETANINHFYDQLKFIVIDSRQSIAEWLCKGIIEDRERFDTKF